ncbi:hypothetical protein ACIOZM_22230 [Pseudomonas sp. NPDC087346]|uniref:hypothetical protein n=1 Tax=Pseudomonas sp. NPDC087346 TaxID=3364438 RepID=UPI00382ECD0F
MNNLYTSLMLDTLYKRVESSDELKKARAVGQQLLSVLDSVPAFKAMARERLIKALAEYNAGGLLDKAFINRGDVDIEFGSRPQGSLLDVYVECLSRNISPTYIINVDGVYDRPDTRDTRYKLSGLDLNQVERIIENARQSLDREHRNSLDRYWQAKSQGTPSFTNRDVLQQAFSRALMAQLSLTVMGKRLELHQGEWIAKTLTSGAGRSLYQVMVKDVAESTVRLPSAFIVDMANLGAPQLDLNNDHHTCVLYTPSRGFEFFLSSNDMNAALCVRLAIPGNALGYPQLQASVFDYCADSHIKHQKDELQRLLSSREHYEAGKLFALENIQRLTALKQHWLTNMEVLLGAVKRGEWPEWLRSAAESVQDRYLQLETSMYKYHEDFQRTHVPCFSLQAYARNVVSAWSESALGRVVDGDTVQVRTSYEMKLGGKTIRQEDTRSLTELVAFGAHDPGYTPKMSLVGNQNSGLTADKIDKWLQTIDVRKDFVETRSAVLPADYRDALSNKLISKLEFDLWVAYHSRKLDSSEFDRVSRAIAGDTSILIATVRFVDAEHTLRDILIFQDGRRGQGPQLVYMRSVKGPNEFLRFNNFDEFSNKLKIWMSDDPAYAASLLHFKDQSNVGKALEHARGLDFDLRQIRATSVELQREANNPLLGAVLADYNWAYATATSIAPLNFRTAYRVQRQQHARLNTELKALYTVEVREAGLPSYEVFARDLIKARIEEVLRSRGSYVDVDPDLVYVQISPTEEWVLSELIVKERAFEPPSSPNWDPQRDYPRFHWSGRQASLDALSIKDIASWSKTLRPGEKYIQLLKSKFQSGDPLYSFKREVHARRQQCEMSLALMSQFAEGQLNAEQFNSLTRIVNELKTPQPVKIADPVVRSESVYEFKIKNTRRVHGVYLFRAVTSKGVEDFIYTPLAPDQIAFRKAADFVRSIRFRSRSLRHYYIDRVAIVDQKVINDYFDELQATVKDVPAPEPFTNNRIRDLRATFNIYIDRLIGDVDERTTSLAEIIGKLIYENVKLAASVIALVIPPVGLALTALEVAKSIYDGVDAHYYGENDEALSHFADALLGLLTLGQAGKGAESVTRLQKSLIDLVGDADTVIGLLATALGQTLGHERLKEVLLQVLDAEAVDSSKTTVY